MRTLFTAARTAFFMTGFVVFWGWIALGVDRRWPLPLPDWTRAPGAVLIALGATLALASAGAFVIWGRGTPAPFDAPREFVAAGPYRRVRNPMYIGGLAVLAGFALYLRSGGILLASPVWLAFAHLFVLGYEEPHLREKFGPAYEQYCRSVSRWMPRLRTRTCPPPGSAARWSPSG